MWGTWNEERQGRREECGAVTGNLERVGRLTGLKELQQTREKESKKASQPQDKDGWGKVGVTSCVTRV